jgi:hypothetical protein
MTAMSSGRCRAFGNPAINPGIGPPAPWIPRSTRFFRIALPNTDWLRTPPALAGMVANP